MKPKNASFLNETQMIMCSFLFGGTTAEHLTAMAAPCIRLHLTAMAAHNDTQHLTAEGAMRGAGIAFGLGAFGVERSHRSILFSADGLGHFVEGHALGACHLGVAVYVGPSGGG